MTIPPCPWCGAHAGVYQNVHVTSSTRQLWDGAGQPCGIIAQDTKRKAYSEIVRCRRCGHKRNGYRVVGGELREVG